MYEYRAKVVRWIDGDTFIAHIDQGFHDWKHDQHLRLVGIDAPDKQPAKARAWEFVTTNWPPGSELIVRTQRDKRGAEEQSFERWMADAWDDDTLISYALVAAGHAVPWDGKGAHPEQSA